MNMKKVLAVLLAVICAISAMAITAFADDYVINLTSDKTTAGKAKLSTVEFTIPVWAEYGYAVAGNTITLTLPTAKNASYFVVANGVNYALGTTDTDVDFANYVVTFGTLAHSWDGQTTVIPQSVVVGDNASLKLVGNFEVEYKADGNEKQRVNAKSFMNYGTDDGAYGWTTNADRAWISFTGDCGWGQKPAGAPYTVYATANDLPAAKSYCWDWNPTDGADIMAQDSYNAAGLYGKWDATLANKAAILGADTAKVVVKLDRALVGNYYFGLIAKYTDGSTYDLAPNFNTWNPDVNKTAYAAYIEIEAPTDTITFDIPTEVLYATRYGIFNHEMTVVCIEDAHKNALNMIKGYEVKDIVVDEENSTEGNTVYKEVTIKVPGLNATMNKGTFGDYAWDGNNITFCGEGVNEYWNQWNNVNVKSFDIVLSTGAVEEEPEENVEIDAPVESETEETEEENVVVEDENPVTGVAFALVPAAIALAVVALKRR